MKTAQDLIAEAKSQVNCVSAEQAKQQVAESADALLLDVREPAEVEQKRVAGFTHIPRGVLEMKIADVCADRDRPVFIHCATGGRAALSAVQLQKMGYSKVYVIDGQCDVLVDVFYEPVVE